MQHFEEGESKTYRIRGERGTEKRRKIDDEIINAAAAAASLIEEREKRSVLIERRQGSACLEKYIYCSKRGEEGEYESYCTRYNAPT